MDWDWHHHDIYVDYGRVGHFHHFTTTGLMVGQGGNIILDIDAGLPIGIEKQVTDLGSIPSDRFKAETNFGAMETKAFAVNQRNLFNDKELLVKFWIQQKGQGQQFGSQRNSERREFGTSERVGVLRAIGSKQKRISGIRRSGLSPSTNGIFSTTRSCS